MKKIILKFMGKVVVTSALLFSVLTRASSQTGLKPINTENITEPNKMNIRTLQVNSEKILLNVQKQNRSKIKKQKTGSELCYYSNHRVYSGCRCKEAVITKSTLKPSQVSEAVFLFYKFFIFA